MHKNVIERMDKQRILDITCVQKRGREKVDKSNFASIVKYDYEYTDKYRVNQSKLLVFQKDKFLLTRWPSPLVFSTKK